MYSFFVKLLPKTVRPIIKNKLQILHYTWLRFISYFLFPFISYRSPLRGYYLYTKDLINNIDGEYILLEKEKSIDFPSYQSSHLNKTASKQKFLSPETFVSVIPNGRVLYDYGIVISPDHRLVGDVSIKLGGEASEHPVMFDLYFPSVEKVSGTLAVISSTAHQRYFHWMLDIMPRFDLLKSSGIIVDKYFINCEKSFQRECIEALGIPEERIIQPQFNTHLQAESLVVPSLPGKIHYATLRSCNFLRSIFLDEPNYIQPYRYLYITRTDALTRRVINEQEVLQELAKYGFESLAIEGLTIKEQAELFASAKIIVAPHGAALTNIVFCPKGTLVIEFMPDTYIEKCFQRLAELLSLNYQCLTAKTYSKSLQSTHDHYVDVQELSSLLQSCGLIH
ncbi:glycosyltransferase family 61 protein [Anabaena azotica]|uniref:Glycosyltransferase family 61 protein n=1 Tax=Anabaena azotica FACHB-119 TaxID=947527 RepID=A0ABR8D5D5_9NOST|nr:glycosyltransferase family 61 protein [Anabaena azotica]MBD2501515.1 glycosyltransferase family 61 protein [Anabaena azotica FACHB-119]